MSAAYDSYLEEHIGNVKLGFKWLKENHPEFFKDESGQERLDWEVSDHDRSKYGEEEYQAYDNYFYGNKTAKVMTKFDKAWLHHIHSNPHHWQYWILFEDDPIGERRYKTLLIPRYYILEMIADWWSFSWKTGNLFEVFDWYNVHHSTIVMNQESRNVVEKILATIKQDLMKTGSDNIISNMKGDKND